ncbi:succinylglutamate desuccinylase [Marinobacter nanhaiticus D15-8W]|uniref:Succinylglutamate desuccinylase n=1 Tax=Marinobacter nanhaiticus D15-8W TaxID=626887 RepID=N6W5A1_9GAMM|nr:succinylglutamate desuccinylase/aspartoacylase family protein [Marinobacter nanhaiticus]ENO15389.1 succinylglutamate desuccinylase [Marinobacter nanhaiticus D15-8W]
MDSQPHPVELSEDESVEDIEASQAIPAADGSAQNTGPETTAGGTAEPTPDKASSEQATRVAPNVDLKEVTPPPQPTPPAADATKEAAKTVPGPDDSASPAPKSPEETATTSPESQAPSTSPESPQTDQEEQTPAPTTSAEPTTEGTVQGEAPPEPAPKAEPLVILGAEVRPGTTTRLSWTPDTSMAGLNQPTPVLVINGAQPGPNLCLTGAVHGDELNGIEIIRRVMYDIQADELSGRIVGVPIVNVHGFQRGSRYLPDRRDLNRNFPGDPQGSLASRVAYSLFNDVIKHCDMLVDIHTGSLKRSNLPQLRADMHNTDVARLTEGFDKMAVVHSEGSPGMLRTVATEHGVVTVTMEAGESLRIQENQIEAGVNSLNSLLEKQGMLSRLFVWGKPEPVYYNSTWIRANHGGILVSDVELGQEVAAGEILGVVTDPITNAQHLIKAEQDGRVIGMAVDQVVMAGFAAYHIGTEARGPEQALQED